MDSDKFQSTVLLIVMFIIQFMLFFKDSHTFSDHEMHKTVTKLFVVYVVELMIYLLLSDTCMTTATMIEVTIFILTIL